MLGEQAAWVWLLTVVSLSPTEQGYFLKSVEAKRKAPQTAR